MPRAQQPRTRRPGERRLRRLLAVAALLLAGTAAVGVTFTACSGDEPAGAIAPAPQSAVKPGPRPLAERRCDHKAADGDELASAFADASAGETVCLASGDFGSFSGGVKTGMVVVQPEPGAEPRLAIAFEGVANVWIDGVTVTEASIGGASRNVTISNSRFTGLAVVHADQMTDARILLDANLHAGIDTCLECFQGRVHVEGDSGSRSGVKIANSLFKGGNSDGVRADANGVEIVGNEFTGLKDQDPLHTDPIQIYGGTNVVIRGNFIHDNDVSAGIMMADGGRGNLVEGNVISGTESTWAMTWYSDDGSVIRHNTFVDGACRFNQPCGVINIGAKEGDRPGRPTVIRDNVLGGVGGDESSAFRADHNLSRDPLPGRGNVQGLPAYAGPTDTRAGHRLAPRSPGERAASDGSDPGIR